MLDSARAGNDNLQRDHSNEVRRLNTEIEKLTNAAAKHELINGQLRDRIARQDEQLHEHQESALAAARAGASDEELCDLREELLAQVLNSFIYFSTTISFWENFKQ